MKIQHSCLIALAFVLNLSPALASQGEHQLSAKALYAHADQHGGGASFEYSFHISDVWRLGADVGWIGGDPNESRPFIGTHFGVQLDALSWVPYLQIAASMHWGEGDNGALSSGVLLGAEAGADYRPSRKISAGLWVGYHHLVASQQVRNMPSVLAAGFKISTYF
jgi:hypothetical protein